MLPLRTLVLEQNSSPGFIRFISGTLFLLSTSCFSANAQTGPHPGARGGPGGGPPAKAFVACKQAVEGNVCSVETQRGNLSGICKTDRRKNALVCVPEGRLGRQSRREAGRGEARDNRPNQGSMREHNIVQSGGVKKLYPATEPPIIDSQYEAKVDADWRIIKANSISQHLTGEFPNAGNPNAISEQDFNIRVPANPVKTDEAIRVKVPAYAFNGVSFDPGAGEFYNGDPSLGWQYEALSGAVELGIDENHAHVQPSGKYHYHGLPTGLMNRLDVEASTHSAQIGWAVDGFPVYALYGFGHLNGGGGIKTMRSSYRLKSGMRPAGSDQPGGVYDGTFTADYEYTQGAGDLDECNGRVTVTPDFPNGTYAYFLTETYPVVPRCVMGTPDSQTQGPRRR